MASFNIQESLGVAIRFSNNAREMIRVLSAALVDISGYVMPFRFV